MFEINHILVLSVGVLAFFSFCLFVLIIPVVFQLSKTLTSLQSLLDIVNDDLRPVAMDLKTSVSGVRNLVNDGKTLMDLGMEKTRIVALSSAYGFLSALKDYFQSYKNERTSYNGKSKGESGIKSKVKEGDEHV